MLLKTTLLSVIFGFFYAPNSFIKPNKENILGEWQVIKLEKFDEDLSKSEANVILNSTYTFSEDNKLSINANRAKNNDYKWHLNKSKEGLIMQQSSKNETDKYYLKSISNTRMVLEQHEDKHVIVSLVMEKL